jgi:predicted ATPase
MIFENEAKRSDFIEWLRILIPEFKNIEIKKSNIDGSYDFLIYEKGSEKPFPRNLISDGTYNILSLMAAVYQNNQPQFLCIEEPENGLHPQAIELLVDFFREKCEEENHHIWLNTHSQTLVRCLEIDEIILVNKIDGATKAKQLTKDDEVDIRTDEAWLSNALGGGVLWSK